MPSKEHRRRVWPEVPAALTSASLLLSQLLAPAGAMAQSDNDLNTKTPIKHVIVIIGENRTFDHIFATYKPKPGQTVDNLLSKQIIRRTAPPASIIPLLFRIWRRILMPIYIK